MVDMEKLTINLTPVDLGQIELLVEQGFYSNRAEFIRIAIRDQLAKHADTLRDAATRQAYVIGALIYGRSTLEEARSTGKRIAIRVVGFLSISDDVTPELARETIESISVHGIFRAGKAVKDALADRTR
ncbi:MAG: CopG family transcriptional regulator [Longimicrobiaceae bacterium]